MSDKTGILHPMSAQIDELSSAKEALLEEGLLIQLCIQGHKLHYSMMNRPSLLKVSDAVLGTLLVHAGQNFKMKRQSAKPETVEKDGEEILYSDHIDIDWQDGIIYTSLRNKRTLQVMSIIIHNLVETVAGKRAKSHGPN